MSAQLARRQFITILGGAALAWPLAARVQQRRHSVSRSQSIMTDEVIE